MNDFNLSADIVQIEISELSPNSKDFKLVGVIISKRSARSFTDRKSKCIPTAYLVKTLAW